jgi:hypothetical protein
MYWEQKRRKNKETQKDRKYRKHYFSLISFRVDVNTGYADGIEKMSLLFRADPRREK